MADVFDQAQARDLQQLEEAMNAQKIKASFLEPMWPRGYCQNPKCGDDVDGNKLFCNSTCAAEHARLTRKI